MNIDYNKVQKDAKAMQVSPHLLIKRMLNYRKVKLREADCRFCENLRYINYKERHMQCFIIGESTDHFANVDHLHRCNAYVRI